MAPRRAARGSSSTAIREEEGEDSTRNVTPSGNRTAGNAENENGTVAEYVRQQEENGTLLSNETARAQIELVIRRKIFPRMKFHQEASGGLDYGGRLSMAVFSELGWNDGTKTEEWKQKVWAESKRSIRQVFKRRKNSVHTSIKRATIGECAMVRDWRLLLTTVLPRSDDGR